jgi:hypothetical protein
MQEGLSARVAGPSTIFPRGYLWQAPLWYGAAAAALALSRWPPLWYRASAEAGLLIAMLTMVSVLSALSARAFRVDQTGVRLGLPPSTRRHGRRRRAYQHLPWSQVDKIRVARRYRGTRIEVFLIPTAALALRPKPYSLARKAWRAILLLIPFWYLLRSTGVATPRGGPARYVVYLRATSVDTMRQELRARAPANVVVTVLVRKGTSVSSPSSAPGRIKGPAYRAAGRWH